MKERYYDALPAPTHFAATFSAQVEAHFTQYFLQRRTGEVFFTNSSDLRLRKHRHSGRNFINAATLTWKARRNALLLRTALPDAEFTLLGFRIAKRDQDTLPAIFYIDERTARDKAGELFSLMQRALDTRQHATQA